MSNKQLSDEQPAGLPDENNTPIVHVPTLVEVLKDLKRSNEYFTKYDTVEKAQKAIEKLISTHTAKQILVELNEARKWATKADSAEQVWQQLTDRIQSLTKDIEE